MKNGYGHLIALATKSMPDLTASERQQLSALSGALYSSLATEGKRDKWRARLVSQHSAEDAYHRGILLCEMANLSGLSDDSHEAVLAAERQWQKVSTQTLPSEAVKGVAAELLSELTIANRARDAGRQSDLAIVARVILDAIPEAMRRPWSDFLAEMRSRRVPYDKNDPDSVAEAYDSLMHELSMRREREGRASIVKIDRDKQPGPRTASAAAVLDCQTGMFWSAGTSGGSDPGATHEAEAIVHAALLEADMDPDATLQEMAGVCGLLDACNMTWALAGETADAVHVLRQAGP